MGDLLKHHFLFLTMLVFVQVNKSNTCRLSLVAVWEYVAKKEVVMLGKVSISLEVIVCSYYM